MKEAKIIILAGQSNAVGVGHVKYLPNHFSETEIEKFYDGYPNILINYNSHDKQSNGFVKTTVNCIEVSKDTLGPEVGIADSLYKRYPGQEIFIVKCAFGGTTLYHDWLSPSCRTEKVKSSERGEGWCYDALIKILNESIAYLKEKGYSPEIKAFCWMQGESDSETLEQVAAYEDLYDRLLCEFKNAFGKYLKNCVYIDGGISEIWNCYKEMNSVKSEYAKKSEDRVFIDTIAHGLTTKNEPIEEPDIYHYDVDCTVKLGQLFAEHIIF